jgi:hypothetical protein
MTSRGEEMSSEDVTVEWCIECSVVDVHFTDPEPRHACPHRDTRGMRKMSGEVARIE